jgi:hypothetical protein
MRGQYGMAQEMRDGICNLDLALTLDERGYEWYCSTVADNKITITWASVTTSIVLSIVVKAPFSNKSNVSYSYVRSSVVT